MSSYVYTNIIKGIPIDTCHGIVERIGSTYIEHLVIRTESGGVLYINPFTGEKAIISNDRFDNDNITIAFSHTARKIYIIRGDSVIIFSIPLMRVIAIKSKLHVCQWYYNEVKGFYSNFVNLTHYVKTSTDGNIYLAPQRYRGVPSITKIDSETDELSFLGVADREFEHIHGVGEVAMYQIDNGDSLGGYYSKYVHTDDLTELWSEIEIELAATGLSYTINEKFRVLLNWEDRVSASPTRRVLAKIGAGNTWKVIDLNNISVYYNTNRTDVNFADALANAVWTDQSGTPITPTYTAGTVQSFAVNIGYTPVSYDPVIFYPTTRKIGRYVYYLDDYLANKTYFPVFAYNPTTGEAIYPSSFNKATTFLNNSEHAAYLANMPVGQGFSGSEEYVLFLKDGSNNWGYFRPDTNAFVVYDPITDPSGYIITEVNLDDKDDPNGLKVQIDYSGLQNEVKINEESVITSDNIKSSISKNWRVVQNADGVSAQLTIPVKPNKNDPLEVEFPFDRMHVTNGSIFAGAEVDTNKFLFAGSNYAGISAITTSGSSYSVDEYFGEVISFYTTCKWGDYYYYGGYLGRSHFINVSSWVPSFQTILCGSPNRVLYSAARTNELVIGGVQVRVAGYNNYMRIAYFDATLIRKDFPNLPYGLDVNAIVTLRENVGLDASYYTDDTVEEYFASYIAVNGLSRSDGIELFTNSARYKVQDIVTYNDIVIISLKDRGPGALYGIRINQNSDGSGVWYDNDYLRSTLYPAILFINKSDLSTLTEDDYVLISFEVFGFQGVDTIGRCVLTDDNVCFFKNEGTDLIIRIKSKSAIEAAAIGSKIVTTFDRTITIPNGGSGTTLGWGGGEGLFLGENTNSVFAFSINNDVYACAKTNITSGGKNVNAYKIDTTTGAYTPFIISEDAELPCKITHNSTTDNVVICKGKQAYIVEDLSLVSLPIDIDLIV